MVSTAPLAYEDHGLHNPNEWDFRQRLLELPLFRAAPTGRSSRCFSQIPTIVMKIRTIEFCPLHLPTPHVVEHSPISIHRSQQARLGTWVQSPTFSVVLMLDVRF